MKQIDKNKKIIISVILCAFVLILITKETYTFFNYVKMKTTNQIKVGRMLFNTKQNSSINLSNVFPIDSNDINKDTSNIEEFSMNINGDTTNSGGIEYLISVSNIRNTINNKTIPIGVDIEMNNLGSKSKDYWNLRGGNSSIYSILSNNSINNNENLVVGFITNGEREVNGTISIKAYLDKTNVMLGDSLDTDNHENNLNSYSTDEKVYLTENEWNSLQQNGLSFKINVLVNEGIWVEEPKLFAYETVKLALSNMVNPPIYVDNFDTLDKCDDVTYIVGDNNIVNFNYVWYSGKLWRILAINSNNTLKLISEDIITSIVPLSSNFSLSASKQWLNEEFYSTLFNASNIIEQNSKWNIDNNLLSKTDTIPQRPRNDDKYITIAPVGLINTFEYYNIYNNSNSKNNYLLTGGNWLTLTSSANSDLYYIINENSNNIFGISNSINEGYGIKPVINLKSDVIFTGKGTKDSPYQIINDIDVPTYNISLLNTRISGEYVKFDNELYRIMNIENYKTKLVKKDFIRDLENIITKKNSSTNIFGKDTNIKTDEYWDYYLNNTWYNSISSFYKDMIVQGTYYLGKYNIFDNYKKTICKEKDITNVTTTNCIKYTIDDIDTVFIGMVGLPRVGEMFSANSSIDDLIDNGLITPNIVLKYTNYLTNTSKIADVVSVNPTFYLNDKVRIVGGEGTETNPFEITI